MRKVIVITGGSEGLGKLIAAKLTKNNKVIIVAPDSSKVVAAAKSLKCDYEVCDVTDLTQMEIAVASILKKHGRIDVLINNAGIWIEGPLEKNDPERIKKVLDVNTLGSIWFSRLVIPQMKKQKSGTIIYTISQAGLYGKAERSVYNASKWALTGFTRSLQMELGQFGIRVTGIYPGYMKTNLFKDYPKKRDFSTALDPSEVAVIVEFILSLPSETMIPEIGIKHVKNT
jgi:3-oxoacyl-[acyl-carrier protein] reductase